MRMSIETNTKEITDLALASYLSAIGHQLISIKPGVGRKLIFVFQKSEVLERDVLAYFNRNGKVDALTYYETVRNLKALALGG